MDKTNVMRVLEQKGVPYTAYDYEDAHTTKGTEVAAVIGKDPGSVFKTLVTTGKSGDHYVFVIPVAEELDLKKAATAVKEKSIEMLPQKQLLPLTGYIHGGCSPIGMRKQFVTTFDETVILYDTVAFSAGKIGHMVEISVEDISKVIDASYADLTKE